MSDVPLCWYQEFANGHVGLGPTLEMELANQQAAGDAGVCDDVNHGP